MAYHGPTLDPPWINHGLPMDRPWTHHKVTMNPRRRAPRRSMTEARRRGHGDEKNDVYQGTITVKRLSEVAEVLVKITWDAEEKILFEKSLMWLWWKRE